MKLTTKVMNLIVWLVYDLAWVALCAISQYLLVTFDVLDTYALNMIVAVSMYCLSGLLITQVVYPKEKRKWWLMLGWFFIPFAMFFTEHQKLYKWPYSMCAFE